MNVNLQMNYWPTYSTNMAECAQPLIAYVDSLREPGRVKDLCRSGKHGCKSGKWIHGTYAEQSIWMDLSGMAFDWEWSPAAVPWILQNCWEYVEFTGNVSYMRDYSSDDEEKENFTTRFW